MLLQSEMRPHAIEPMLGRHLVIDIAIDTWIDARSAVPFQRGIELAAALAEVIKGRVTECEYGVAERLVSRDPLPCTTAFQNGTASSGGSPSP